MSNFRGLSNSHGSYGNFSYEAKVEVLPKKKIFLHPYTLKHNGQFNTQNVLLKSESEENVGINFASIFRIPLNACKEN